MADVEVYIDLDGSLRPVGLLRRHASRREETVTFEYDESWLADDQRFSIEPALALMRGVFPPPSDQPIFGSIGDSAPDTWGRRLMQRAERRKAEREGRRVRTLGELDYLLVMKRVWARCDSAGAETTNSKRPCPPVFPRSSNWGGCSKSPSASYGTRKPMRICN